MFNLFRQQFCVLWMQTNESHEWQQHYFFFAIIKQSQELYYFLFAKLPLLAACFLQGLLALFFGLLQQKMCLLTINSKSTTKI